MNDLLLADFLVQSAALRVIYHDLVSSQYNDARELEGILAGLTAYSVNLNQFVDGAKNKPQSPQALMLEDEAFEDVIALMWQIAWNLQKEQTLDINPLREQLQQLHSKLDKGF